MLSVYLSAVVLCSYSLLYVRVLMCLCVCQERREQLRYGYTARGDLVDMRQLRSASVCLSLNSPRVHVVLRRAARVILPGGSGGRGFASGRK